MIATAYFTDGTKAEITLGDYYRYNSSTEKYTKDNSVYTKLPTTAGGDLAGWYSYSINSSDEYNIRESKSDDSITVEYSSAVNASNLLVEGEEVVFASGEGKDALGNSDTILIVDDGRRRHCVHRHQQLPPILMVKEAKEGVASGTINYMMEKDDSSKTYVAVAFVDASSENIEVDDNTTDTLLYVLDEDSNYVDNEDNETVLCLQRHSGRPADHH